MLPKFKLFFIGIVLVVGIIVLLSGMFIKQFDSTKDFSCCKGDQLFLHHYYEYKIIGVTTSHNFVIEPIGKPAPDGCNVQCE